MEIVNRMLPKMVEETVRKLADIHVEKTKEKKDAEERIGKENDIKVK
jgi:hypothetical protein